MSDALASKRSGSVLPEGWRRVPLEEVAEVRTGLAKGKPISSNAVSLPYLRVANVQDGRLDLREVKRIEVEHHLVARYSLKAGDILMTEGGDFDKLGRGAVWHAQIEPCLHQNHVFAVRPIAGKVDSGYLSALAGSEYGRTYFLSCAKRSTNLASINSSQLKAFPVVLPPLSEQKAISGILRTWDDAISAAERLVHATQRRNRWVMWSLLTGKHRLEGQSKAWKYLDLDAVFERVVRKNVVGNDNVLTISGEHGLISQREFFNKSVASADLSGYTLLYRGEFAYNKSYSAGYPMGAIKPLSAYEAGVVSSLYLCFRLRPNVDACPDFFRHYFEVGLLNEGISGIAQEGARNHGLLNVGVGDFFKLRLHVPDAEEQRAISTVINTAEAEERVLQLRLGALRSEKQGLMHQLVAGKRRVRHLISKPTA